jgi:hypothetical protein
MTVQELAMKLDGSEYPFRVTPAVRGIAVAEGLLIVYGASDDLIEFEGAWSDEAGVNDGGTVTIDRIGIIPDFGEVEHEVSECEKWIARGKSAAKIEALWCAEEGYTWTYKTDIPHADFLIMEEGESYCRGMVIALSDLPGEAK